MSALRVVGHPVRAVDWDERTRGRASYVSDVDLPGTLVAGILRSPHPHARLTRLDLTAARRVAGVAAVVSAADLMAGTRYLHHGGDLADRPPLAEGVVRYRGEEIAAVAAEDLAAVQAGLAAIDVRFRRRAAPLDVASALTSRRGLHARATGETGVAIHDRGSWGARPPQGPAVTVTQTYRTQRVAHVCMEPHATLARWSGDGEVLELWTSTQAPWFVQHEVAHVLGLEPDQVICRDVAVGGGFGAKGKVAEHEVVAALLARVTRRPVRLVLTREEEFEATKPRHAFTTRLRLGADPSGRLRTVDAGIEVDNGAYNHFGPSVMKVGVKTFGSLYRPEHVSWDARLVDTALPPGGQFRGYGGMQTAVALECGLDELAVALDLDPIELRRRNDNPPGTTTIAGLRLGSARLDACLDAVAAGLDWEASRGRRAPGPGDVHATGVGVAAAMHGSGSFAFPAADRSAAGIDVDVDGGVRVRFGSQDAGTGQRTVLAQIAAEALGVELAAVSVVLGDGELTPHDMGAWSSRGTHMGGHAVLAAVAELTAALTSTVQAELGEGTPTFADGHVHVGSRSLPLGAVVAACPRTDGGTLSVEATYHERRVEPFGADRPTPNISASYTFAAHGAEVAVDPATGQVRVTRYVAAHDIGRALNPLGVEGQIVGGVAQGLGMALGEEVVHTDGRVVNGSYLDYPVARAADLPDVRAVLVEGPEPAGPFDAKSVGELPIYPAAPAVLNAVFDATGLRFRELPLTPDRVLDALADADGRARVEPRGGRTARRWWVGMVRWAYPRGLHALLHRYGPRTRRRHVPTLEAVTAPEDLNGLEAAVAGGARMLGGGNDLHLRRRQGLDGAAKLVGVAGVPELQVLEVEDGVVRIGGGVTLARVATTFGERLPLLGQAIDTIASPQVRAVATVAGNLLQEKRCAFFRNGFDCYQRSGPLRPCYAVLGDHRFHHAAMDAHRCQAVTPSDLATVLVAMDATLVTSSAAGRRERPLASCLTGPGEVDLADGEVVVEVRLPATVLDRPAQFEKLARYDGDFAVVSVAYLAAATTGVGAETDVAVTAGARLVLGAVAPVPWRSHAAEVVAGSAGPSPAAVAEALRRELGERADPLPGNRWKLDAAVGLARRAVDRAGVTRTAAGGAEGSP